MLVLTDDHGIVGESTQCGLPLESWFHHILKPGIKDFVQEEIGQDR
jgi:hypothetical protein